MGQGSGHQYVVGIDERQILAGACFDACVAGASAATVLLRDDFDTRISGCICPGDYRGLVRAAVVDHDNFLYDILALAGQDAVEALCR